AADPRRAPPRAPAYLKRRYSGAPRGQALLSEREDVEELDVEPVRRQAGGLGDSVALLEDQQELVRVHLVRAVELLEPEAERRALLAGGEEELALHVVGRSKSWPSWSVNSQPWRGAAQSSIAAASTVSASSTS